MKKLLCMLLCAMLLPVCALAEDSTADALTLQELSDWAATYIARAMAAEVVNTPAENRTAEGYEFLFDFGAVYADTPDLGADSVVSSVVVTSMEAAAPRGVNVGSGLQLVLDAYYNENPQLLGSYDAAVLYTLDNLPEDAGWAKVNRDGQRVQTIQYAVHEQLPSGGEGYADAGVIYTMAENRVIWCPTLSAIGNLRGKGRFDEAAVQQILDSAMENVRAFAALGGLLAPGSDAGAWSVPHGSTTEEGYFTMANVPQSALDQGFYAIQAKF